jgi:hypothetical membrane protein
MSIQTQPDAIRLRPTATGAESSAVDARLPGFLLFFQAALFMTIIMLAASIAPDYDYGAAAISDLGVISQTALPFNASLVAVGLLNAGAGLLLHAVHGRTWITSTFVIAGGGAVGAGLVPLNTGDLHSIFALVAFAFFNLEAVAGAAVVRGPMRLVSALAGIVGLTFVVLMIIGDSGSPAVFGPIGHGGAERMIVYPVMLWLMAFGGYLMAGTIRSEEIS